MWAWPRENLSSVVCEQQMGRPACASVQSDQSLCYSLIGKYLARRLRAKFWPDCAILDTSMKFGTVVDHD